MKSASRHTSSPTGGIAMAANQTAAAGQCGSLLKFAMGGLKMTLLMILTATQTLPAANCKSLVQHELLADLMIAKSHQPQQQPQDLSGATSGSSKTAPLDLIRLLDAESRWVPLDHQQQHQQQGRHQHETISLHQVSGADMRPPVHQHNQQHHVQSQANNQPPIHHSFLLSDQPFSLTSSPSAALGQKTAEQKPCDKAKASSQLHETQVAAPLTSSGASVGARQTLSGSPNNSTAEPEASDDHDDGDDDNDNELDDEPEVAREPRDPLAGHESVAHESSMLPAPQSQYLDEGDQAAAATGPRRYRPMANSANQNDNDDENAGEESSGAQSDGSSEAMTGNGNGNQQSGNNESGESQNETPPDELAERREMEAAEASEAEAANRSALAEQQQAQREIIMAQAQSEAKAIREQQEALLKQQQMQQQILMQRDQSYLDHDKPRPTASELRSSAAKRPREPHQGRQSSARSDRPAPPAPPSQEQPRRRQDTPTPNNRQVARGSQAPSRRQQQLVKQRQPPQEEELDEATRERMVRMMDSTQHQFAPIDNQFSDQLDSGIVDRGMESASSSAQLSQQHRRDKNFNQAAQQQQQLQHQRDLHLAANEPDQYARNQAEQRQRSADSPMGRPPVNEQDNQAGDELSGDYSMRKLQHSDLAGAGPLPVAVMQGPSINLQTPQELVVVTGARFNLTGNDLLTAAQHHHYGAHYDSLGKHHKKGGGGYYQFAESHKKGQFESGFRRGNKKFTISSHNSQHKGHAEGHFKCHGKKGKCLHYWSYKHKNKKHYGGGDSYGGGHHHY